MRLRRFISTICLVTLMVQNIPVNAVTSLSENNNSQILDNGTLNEVISNSEDITNVNGSENNISETLDEEISNKEVVNSESITSNKSEINKEEISNLESTVSKEDSENAITKIVGSENIRIYLGEEIDYKDGIKATDTNGKDITDLVTVEGKVDNSKVGTYELKYSVKDELGNTATLIRKVKVLNKNIFNVYVEKVNEETKEVKKETLFTFYLDNKDSKFVVENQSSNMIDPSKENEVAFEIKVIDKDNKEKLKIELLGKDTGNSNKLEALKELKYSYGDYIQIKPMQIGLSIEGPILGDINTEKEDYSDGIDNLDYINNVRFKIVEDGIEAIYNKAPEIRGLEAMDNLLTTREEQLKGVEVIDDHDGVISNEKIVITEEKDNNGNTIALRYSIEDSWGRNTSILRELKVLEDKEEKIQEQSITFNTNILINNIIEVHGSEYPDGDTLRFKLRFNQNSNKVEIYDRDSRVFDNKIKDTYFKIIIYTKAGTVRKVLSLNGSDRADNKLLDEFNGTSFTLGDQIYIYHAKSDTKLKIQGSIEDADFSYNEGIPADKLEGHRFQLLKSGFKYLTNEAPVITWENQDEKLQITRGEHIDLLADISVSDDIDGKINKSAVSVTAYDPNRLGDQTVTYTVKDSWGVIGTATRTITIVADSNMANTFMNIMSSNGVSTIFTLRFDDVDKKIILSNRSNEKLNTENPNELSFRIRIFSKAGITKKDIKLNGGDSGLNSALDQLDDYRFTSGDTIELWSSTPENSIKIIGTIDKDPEITEDYEDGIQDEKFMKDVRFQLGGATLKAIYNDAPVIVFNDDLTIKRGEEFNPLRFIKEIKDDHDNLNINLVRVKYNKDEVFKVGKHEIQYTITDKWGKSSTVIKEIDVLTKNKLEQNTISLLKNDETNKPIITLYFDDVEKLIYKEIVNNEFISGDLNSDVFIIKVFDDEGIELGKSIIKGNEFLDEFSLEEITDLDIDYNYMISITGYQYNKVSINGDVISSKNHNYSNGFEDDDQMINTRFKVTENGLEAVYNEAPEIHGIEEISIMKNSLFDKLENVYVTDDHDLTIDNSEIEFIGEIDTSIVGTQTIKYKVTDSWGRSVEVERKIYVKPVIESNTIEFNNSNNELAFKIGFDFKTFRFSITDRNDQPLDQSNEDVVFRISVYNANKKLIKEVSLLGSDTGTSDKLDELKNIPIGFETYIRLWASDSTKLSIKGNLIKSDNIDENYEDGIQNIDFMDNVIFKGSIDGLMAVYNNQPEITVIDEELSIYKGDDYRSDLLNAITITDPDETIEKESVEITVKKVIDDIPEENPMSLDSISDLGEYEAEFTVTDSWGREDSEKKRFTLLTSIDRNEIIFGGHNKNIGRYTAFKIGFDSEAMQIKLKDRSALPMNNQASNSRFYVISVYNEDGTLKTGSQIVLSTSDAATSTKLNPLQNLEFQYGDYIEMNAYQAFRLSISGVVRNALEDYSDGIFYSDDFNYTRFYITDSGLEADFRPEELQEGQSILEYGGTQGGFPFKIQFNHNDGSVTFPATTTFYCYGTSSVVFRCSYYNSQENQLYTYSSAGGSSGVSSYVKDKLASGFNDGDYINIELINIPEEFTGVRVRGAISEENKSYADKVEGHNDIKNVRFYLRRNENQRYLDPVYNYGPVFSGVEDINIFEEDMATFDPRSEVSVTDDIDETTPQFTVEGPPNLSSVGKYVYTYRSTDSWGRETVVQRNVYVRPSIYKNKIMLYAKEATKSTLDITSAEIDPAFEILFDNETNKYVLNNQKDTMINERIGDGIAFKISIYGPNGNEKATINLQGNDKGTSTKLDILNEVNYEEGDYIRLWASEPKNLIITGDIGKEEGINNQGYYNEDYNDGIDDDDFMNNVAFIANNSGLTSIYNEAPKIINVTDRIVFFGDEPELLSGIVVSDDKDNDIEVEDIKIIGEVNQDEIGIYSITYVLTDSWGRSTSQDVRVIVVSKISQNTIDVYGNSSNNTNEKKFTLRFDVNTYKIVVDKNSNSTNSTTSTERYFEIVVRNRDAKEKLRITLNENEMSSSSEIDKLTQINYANNDTISVYSINRSNVRINGNIENSNGKTFDNGFESEELFENVRFKITDRGFELIEREILQVAINGDLTIKRGDLSDIYDGLMISANNPDNYYGIQVDVQGFNENILGEYNATYLLTDSWGNLIEIPRKITVIERNTLEENKIRLLDSNNGNSQLLEFNMDTINQQIIVNRSNKSYSGNIEELMTLNLYDENGITKDIITVTATNLDSLSGYAVDYNYGDYISVSVYNKEEGISITGIIEDQNESYEDGVSNSDNIDYVRFMIKEDNFKAVFNNAPILEVGENLTLYKDESIDLYKGVIARDDDLHDSVISEADVQINTDLDITQIGNYKAIYSVEDTWGRKTVKERNITVKSSLENTKIQFFEPTSEDPKFEIHIDNTNNNLVVNKNFNILDYFKINRGSNDEKLYELKLFDSYGNIKKSIVIMGDMNELQIDAELRAFDNTIYEYGDYISVYASDSKNGVKILGAIDKETIITEDYSDGIDDPDFMNNVRFKINKEALGAIYNEAPSLQILNPEETIEVYKGDNHNYGENTIISDDHDIDIGESDVSISEEDKEKMNTLGTHRINIILTDSWGRSVQAERIYKVKSAIDRNIITFGGHKKGEGRFTAFKMSFNSETMRIQLSDRSSNAMNNEASSPRFYVISVYDKEGNRKTSKEIVLSQSDKGTSNKLDPLNNLQFEYGDYIEMNAYQAFRVSISGVVRNALEDYSDAVDMADDFEYTRFYITDAGLEASFKPDYLPDGNESIIEYIGTSGGTPFKIKFNHVTKEVTFPTTTGFYNYEVGRSAAFKVIYYSSEDGIEHTYISMGSDTGVNSGLRSKLSSGFNDGDYFKFEYINVPENYYGVRINGKIGFDSDTDEELLLEDFTDGIQNRSILENTRFYLNKDGEQNIKPVKIGSPSILGVDDREVLQGSEFDESEGVTAINYDGTELTGQIIITGQVNTGRIGLNEIKYQVTNSEGVTTIVYRNVNVYSQAVLTVRDMNRAPVEEGSIITEEEKINYLKSIVVANDSDEGDISANIEITDTNFNPDVSGTYYANYSVTNSFGKVSTLENVQIEVIRTINVSVPTVVPFQVVTNLINEEADPFVSGMLKLTNNRTSDVRVSVKSFTKEAESGNLDIVDPNSLDWENLNEEDSMSKMALGMFVKEGLRGDNLTTKQNPLWFSNNMTTKTFIGTLPRATSLSEPYEAKLSFTSKHGNNFIGGRSKGNFQLVFEFE